MQVGKSFLDQPLFTRSRFPTPTREKVLSRGRGGSRDEVDPAAFRIQKWGAKPLRQSAAFQALGQVGESSCRHRVESIPRRAGSLIILHSPIWIPPPFSPHPLEPVVPVWAVDRASHIVGKTLARGGIEPVSLPSTCRLLSSPLPTRSWHLVGRDVPRVRDRGCWLRGDVPWGHPSRTTPSNRRHHIIEAVPASPSPSVPNPIRPNAPAPLRLMPRAKASHTNDLSTRDRRFADCLALCQDGGSITRRRLWTSHPPGSHLLISVTPAIP